MLLKLIYSEKATKFFEISTLLLSYLVPVSKVEISQNFVAFSEYTNFKILRKLEIVQTYLPESSVVILSQPYAHHSLFFWIKIKLEMLWLVLFFVWCLKLYA